MKDFKQTFWTMWATFGLIMFFAMNCAYCVRALAWNESLWSGFQRAGKTGFVPCLLAGLAFASLVSLSRRYQATLTPMGRRNFNIAGIILFIGYLVYRSYGKF